MNRPWIAFSPDITDEDALKRVAKRMRVGVKLLELTRTGGAVLVRLRESKEEVKWERTENLLS